MPVLGFSYTRGWWPFAIIIWTLLAAIPPLFVHYRSRKWRIPWWHWPFAIGQVVLAVRLAKEYTFYEVVIAESWSADFNEHKVIRHSLVELFCDSLWLGIPIFFFSLWLTLRQPKSQP